MSVPDPNRAPEALFLLHLKGADARSRDRLAAEIDDLHLPKEARLDDRTRATILSTLGTIIGKVEREIMGHATSVLSAQPAGAMTHPIVWRTDAVVTRLTASGLLRDPDLMAELIGRVRQDLFAEALMSIPARADRPSVLMRLADHPDGVVASAAAALLVAENRRRGGDGMSTELPATLHHRLVWWVAAALCADRPREDTLDRALADAARHSIAAHDEGERPEAIAMRLAEAIDTRPDELADMLVDSIGDARVTLFVALIAHAAELGYAEARAIAFDPDADRLGLVLRAQSLGRTDIARIVLMLAEADHRRDIETFAGSLDTIVAIAPDVARAALAPSRLHPDLRSALSALARMTPP